MYGTILIAVTAPSEQDPTRGIVDIDTFGLYVVKIRSNVFSRSRHILNFPISEPGEEPLGASDYYVFLLDHPWDDLPKTTQEMMKLKYDPVPLDHETNVDVTVTTQRIEFSLASRSMYNESYDISFFDLHGEGALLQFRVPEWSTTRKGLWYISRHRFTREEEQELFELSEQMYNLGSTKDRMIAFDTLLNSKIENHVYPAQLSQLQDIAAFLDRNQDRMGAIRFT